MPTSVSSRPLVLSTTAYSEASVCLKRFEYHQRHHLVTRPSGLSPRIRKGVWIHRALDAHGKGEYWMDALSECSTWAKDHGVPEEDRFAIFDECERILQGYFAYWEQHPRWKWQVVTSEEPIEYAVSNSLTIRATVDKIVKWRGGLWLVEHKSTSEIPSASWRATDPQTALQYAVCALSGKYDVVGIIFDYLVTREPPVPRVKNDGRFYAGTEKQTTTTAAFDSVIPLMKARYTDPNLDPDAFIASFAQYVQTMREQVVNDGHFFQRFEVYRPDAAITQTLRDVRATQEMILLAEKMNHWRRLNNIIYCQRFCSYADLCSAEYISGKESSLRQTDYMIEDLTDREGRAPSQRVHP